MAKILLIDDDTLLTRMYQRKLAEDGYEVRTAPDGLEGLEAIRQEKPDLILLDILMPRMNGYETLKRIKENKEWAKIPVLMLTSLDDKPEERKKLKEFGVEEYLIKSALSLPQLSEKVNQYLKP